MRLGAVLPLTDGDGRPRPARAVAEAAALIEASGYTSIWVFDAIGRGFLLPDGLMGLAIAAAATTSVELGTGVLQLPLRNTVELAHRALSLHYFSGGRLLLGVGPGSTPDDFRVVGADYGARFGSFAAEWPRFRQLLTTGADGDARLTPWTVDHGPAVLMAAWRGPLVTRAAQDADGWIASAAYNDDATLAAALGRFRDAGGRRAIVTNIQVGPDIKATSARLRALREMGFDDAVVFDLRPAPERWRTIYDAAS